MPAAPLAGSTETLRRSLIFPVSSPRTSCSLVPPISMPAKLAIYQLVIRLVARFPFNIATDARLLIWANGLPCEDRIERGADVPAGHRNSISWPAIVHLTAINEPLIAVEDKNVRGAGGPIRLGHCLRFIIEIRKDVPGRLSFLRHFRRTVGGIIDPLI